MKTPTNLAHDLAALRSMSVAELKNRYAEVFGETSRSGNRQFLIRRIAWRLQALAEGNVEDRLVQLRQQALALACDADLRVRAPCGPETTAFPLRR